MLDLRGPKWANTMTTRLASVLPLLLLACSKPEPSAGQPSIPASTLVPPVQASKIPEETNPLLTHPLYIMSAAFIESIHAGRFEDAYSKMAKLYRSAVTLKQFRATVQSNPYLKAATTAKLWRINEKDGVGQGNGTLNTSDGGIDVLFHCVYESAGWRITGLTIAGAPALTIPAKTR